MITLASLLYREDDFTLKADWTIAPHRFVAVLGASGAGKSTLLSIISGFVQPLRGDVFLNDQNVTTLDASKRPVSLVFQDNNVFPHLDVWTNVALGADPALKLTRQQSESVENALEQVDLRSLRHRKPGEISGGELQRVALARVLVRDRPILLLDEAFSGLGPGKRHEMLAMVQSLHHDKKLTTIMVTHQPEDARAFADDIIFVADGIARQPVPSAEFFSGARDAAVGDYLGRWR